jgi:hypothetical protein
VRQSTHRPRDDGQAGRSAVAAADGVTAKGRKKWKTSRPSEADPVPMLQPPRRQGPSVRPNPEPPDGGGPKALASQERPVSADKK